MGVDVVEQFREKLQGVLEGDFEDVKVSAFQDERTKFFGVVVSPTFEGMDDGRRQALVWRRVLDNFTPYEQRRIDFIYTDAPSEVVPSVTTTDSHQTS